MKIKNITITKLFGYIDYDIDLNNNDCFILTGPNGYGKTIILKIIKNIITNNFAFFETIKFDEIVLIIDDISLCLKKSEFIIDIDNFKYQHPALNIILNQTYKTFPFALQASADFFKKTQDYHLIHPISRIINDTQSSVLDELTNLFSIGRLIYISDSRLDIINSKKSSEKLNTISQRLKNHLELIENEIHKFSNNLSSSLLIRLFDIENKIINIDYFDDRLIGINRQKEKFSEYGFIILDEQFATQHLFDKTIYFTEQQKISISLYLDIESQKLDEFKFILNKIELFENIINSSFTFKKIKVHKSYGFKILDNKNCEILFDSLSSGEKHLLLLAYDLVFEANKGDLILIDEPEISFHPQWKTDILTILNNAIKLNNISQIILTTHSPYVINSKWDITYDLYSNGKIN